MTIETVLEIFFFVKGQYDHYESNTKEKSLIIKRVLVLEDPLLRIQSKELEIPATSIDTLKEVLDFVKDFLHEYNNTSMWKSVIRAVRSGKYAADFHQCNVMIDRALATVNLSLNISNEERRQQDSESMKEFVTNLCSHVISDMRAHGSVGNEEEKQRCEEILSEVKALSTKFEFSPEEKADVVAMHEEVKDLINVSTLLSILSSDCESAKVEHLDSINCDDEDEKYKDYIVARINLYYFYAILEEYDGSVSSETLNELNKLVDILK
jgi:hypothetical protein